jgi:bifunctional DNA-binding transcriptional regulator/antitoxin component of YhaV-PrlF toxin-antitoxin module
VDGIEVEVEQRRRLGLPAEVLIQAGLRPGDRVQIQIRRDGRLVLIPMSELLDKYSGAIPGLSAATSLPEMRSE